MQFEEPDPRHGLWEEDSESGLSEEEEMVGSDTAEDGGWLKEELMVSNESMRPQPCCQQLLFLGKPWTYSPALGGDSLTSCAGHLSSTGLSCEPTDTDLRTDPAGLSHQAPNPTASEKTPAYESSWEPGPVPSLSTRTLSHPSFYPYYAALSGSGPGANPAAPEGQPQCSGLQGDPALGSGLLLPITSSDFFYTDPLMPPGHRVYNYLSHASQEVCCQSLHLNTPAPIMSVREASPPPYGTKWLSEAEYNAVSALLELPYEELGCSPREDLSGTQLLLAAVELEHSRVVTQEAASALLSLHNSPDPLKELLWDNEPLTLPHGLEPVVLGAFFPQRAAGASTLAFSCPLSPGMGSSKGRCCR